MFEAYSQKLERLIHIQSADPNEIYCCLNSFCTAKFKVKSLDGKRAAHFAKTKTSTHLPDCPYQSLVHTYVNSDKIIKTSLDDIYNATMTSHGPNRKRTTTAPPTDTDDRKLYVRTPKQLLAYCLDNPLDTPYRDGLTVKDIILDSRNLESGAKFEGVQGLRLLLGTTANFEYINGNDFSNGIRVLFRIKALSSKSKTPLTLRAFTDLPPSLSHELYRYMMKKFNGTFKDHSIAVLGNWEIIKQYEVRCTVINPKHVIYTFNHN